MRILKQIQRIWDACFFSKSSPANLCISRFLFFGVLVYLYRGVEYVVWSDFNPLFWFPISFFEVFDLTILPNNALAAVTWIWKISLLFSCIGLFTRFSTFVAFLLGAYLLGLPHNFGKIHHSDGLIVIIMAIMALSQSGEFFSLDRLIRRLRNKNFNKKIEQASKFSWPVKCVCLAFLLVFFAAGVAKLRYNGLGWVFSDNMANIFWRHNAIGTGLLNNLIPGLVTQERLCRINASLTLLLELAAPVALFNKPASIVILPGLFFLQFGIALLLGVWFRPFLAAYVFWVPWEQIIRWLETLFDNKLPAKRRL